MTRFEAGKPGRSFESIPVDFHDIRVVTHDRVPPRPIYASWFVALPPGRFVSSNYRLRLIALLICGRSRPNHDLAIGPLDDEIGLLLEEACKCARIVGVEDAGVLMRPR